MYIKIIEGAGRRIMGTSFGMYLKESPQVVVNRVGSSLPYFYIELKLVVY